MVGGRGGQKDATGEINRREKMGRGKEGNKGGEREGDPGKKMHL